MSDRSRFAVRLAVTLGLLGVVFYRIDAGEFLRVVASASIALLLGAALIQVGSIFLSALRWRVILKNFDVQIDYDPLARITFIGFFFNLFLPSGIGGDFFRAYYLGQRVGRGMSTTLTTTILERSAGLCALLIIGLAASALTPLKFGGVRLLFVFLIILSLFILGNLLLFHPWTHRLLTRFLSRWKRDGLEEKMDLVAKGLRQLRRNPSAVVQAVAVSLLVQFLAVVIAWVAATSIGLKAPFPVFLTFIPLINLTIMIPITINGLGLRESLYAVLFQQIGVANEMSVSLSLLTFAVFLLAGLPGAVLYHLYKRDLPTEKWTGTSPCEPKASESKQEMRE